SGGALSGISGSGGGAGSGLHAAEPGGQILAFGIERLTDIGHEVEKGKQHDVGHRELVAGDEGIGAHQAVQPFELVGAVAFNPSAASGMQRMRLWNIFKPSAKRNPLAAGSMMLRSIRRVHMRVLARSSGVSPISDGVSFFFSSTYSQIAVISASTVPSS